MKKIFLALYKVLVVVLMLGVLGCSEDFLETTPTTDISDQDVFKTPEGARTVLNGMYRWLREYNSGNTNRHEDMGQKSNDITLDVLDGRDVQLNTFAWYLFDQNLGFDFTAANWPKTEGIWRFYYKLINNANSVIVNVETSSFGQDDKDELIGEALVLRAYGYFYLVNFFQHSYSFAGATAPGVPIYLTPASASDKGNPRGTVGDVYTQILADLNRAVTILDPSGARGGNKTHVNINVAYGMLAKTYLTMENWGAAATAAANARTGYDLCSAVDFTSGFNNSSNGEWIWGLDFNTDQQHYYYSFFSMFDLERAAGYYQMRMNDQLLASYSATDIRANAVVGDYALVVDKMDPPINATSYVSAADQWVSRKFRDTPDQTGSYVMMRSAEMVLVQAEAAYELGDEPGARAYLFEVQGRADASAVISVNTGQTLLDEILYERRKELWGEGLASTLDLKRRQLPLVRTGNVFFTGSLPANSNLLVWQIPQSEIDVNENIDETDQNPL